MEDKKLHTITITEQKNLCITAVKQVDFSTVEKLLITLLSGSTIAIYGSGLKISSFSVDTGVLCASGRVDSIKYSGEKLSLLKRLTK